MAKGLEISKTEMESSDKTVLPRFGVERVKGIEPSSRFLDV